MLEAIDLTLDFGKGNDYLVNVLDHDGLRTSNVLNSKQGVISIKGIQHRAVWYELVKKNK